MNEAFGLYCYQLTTENKQTDGSLKLDIIKFITAAKRQLFMNAGRIHSRRLIH